MARTSSLKAAKSPGRIARVRASREARQHRYDVFMRDDWTCVYCGDKGRPRRLDHKVPVSKGGTSFPSNLCCACDLCDELKGNMTARQFLKLPRSATPVKGVSRP